MFDNRELKEEVLHFVLQENYRPLKPKIIASKLGLTDKNAVIRAVKKLVQEGKLEFGDKHLVVKPSVSKHRRVKAKPFTVEGTVHTEDGHLRKIKSNETVGVFRKTSGGFGFVTPLDSEATDRSEDIFIPKTKTLDAADRDTVLVRLSRGRHGNRQRKGQRSRSGNRKSDHNRISGRIIKVVERKTHRFVGTYRVRGSDGFVYVDGDVFDASVLVGDAGAKNCKPGDKVVVEIVHFPTAQSLGEGVIVEVLGDRGTPGVDTLMVIREFGLPEDFSKAVLDDARAQAEKFDESITRNRTDFTRDTVVTIDPKTARDFDDAISLKRIENGHWLLGVHIADVSHFVPPRSALDNEAFSRGTSVYLPDRVIPMLPEVISNNLASLQPKRVRYTMTALIEFTAEGIPIGTELHRGAIQSDHRFNYEEIDDYLANDRPWKKKLTPKVFTLVRDMHTLAMQLRKRRLDGGAINLVLPEIQILLDDDGRVAGATTAENTESHQIIEEFMLAANEAVARYLVDQKLFLLRRIHETPTESKLSELTQFVRQLGIDCGSLQDRFELKRVVEESEDRPESHAIHFAILRSMQKAIYSPKEAGHFALASDAYCHFTSPIRRYPDLVIHRMVGDLIDGKRPKSDFDRLNAFGKHCSELEKRAADAERELKKLKLLSFMEDQIGSKLTAVITGVEAFGVFAQGVEIPAEGLVPVSKLPPDRYQFDRAAKTLNGFRRQNQFRLGDQVEVQVDLVDLDARVMEYRLIRRIATANVSVSSAKKPQRKTKKKATKTKVKVKKSTKKKAKPTKKKAKPTKKKSGKKKPAKKKASKKKKLTKKLKSKSATKKSKPRSKPKSKKKR